LQVKLGAEGVIPAGQHAFPFSFPLPVRSSKGQPLAGSFRYKDGHAGFSGSRSVQSITLDAARIFLRSRPAAPHSVGVLWEENRHGETQRPPN
jgi:hypothetical protein